MIDWFNPPSEKLPHGDDFRVGPKSNRTLRDNTADDLQNIISKSIKFLSLILISILKYSMTVIIVSLLLISFILYFYFYFSFSFLFLFLFYIFIFIFHFHFCFYFYFYFYFIFTFLFFIFIFHFYFRFVFEINSDVSRIFKFDIPMCGIALVILDEDFAASWAAFSAVTTSATRTTTSFFGGAPASKVDGRAELLPDAVVTEVFFFTSFFTSGRNTFRSNRFGAGSSSAF